MLIHGANAAPITTVNEIKNDTEEKTTTTTTTKQQRNLAITILSNRRTRIQKTMRKWTPHLLMDLLSMQRT